MTAQQKEQVTGLRLLGYGYQAIAQQLALSRDAVKSYCARNKIVPQSGETIDYHLCPECFSILSHVEGHKKKRFCSDRCRHSWWIKHKTGIGNQEACECRQCGKSFYKYRSETKKFCSKECYFQYRYGGGHEKLS